MNTPSSQQLSGEEFKAIVRYETRNEPFKAEKVTIKEAIDKNGIDVVLADLRGRGVAV